MRDSLNVSYIEHLLSFSSSLKNKEVLANQDGGKIERKVGQLLWKTIRHLVFSPLNMAHVCVSSYSWVISLSLSLALVIVTLCWSYLVESMLPIPLSCHRMFKGSVILNQSSYNIVSFSSSCQFILS